MPGLDAILYPRLSDFPVEERARALDNARKVSFDVIELVGIATGVVLATALTRYELAQPDILVALSATAANFFIAIPFLVLFVGPFLVRRVRRGLALELAKRARR